MDLKRGDKIFWFKAIRGSVSCKKIACIYISGNGSKCTIEMHHDDGKKSLHQVPKESVERIKDV